MRIRRIASKIRGSIFLFGISILSLLKVPAVFADIPGNVRDPKNPYPHMNPDPALNYGQVSTYVLLTLALELPIFYLLGFKSKKALGLVAIVNIISVSAFHILNFTLNVELFYGVGLLIAELLIIIFEFSLLAMFLRKEIAIKKIIIATVVANTVSALIGIFIINIIFDAIGLF